MALEPISKSTKLCDVCSDIALGNNFNGVTCISCKAFFRRTALRKKSYECHKGGNCKIDKYTRIKCKACRLQKCFNIGMRKELIFSRKFPNYERIFSENQFSLHREDWDKNRAYLQIDSGIAPLTPNETEQINRVSLAMNVFRSDSSAEITGYAKNILHFYNIPGELVAKVIQFCKAFHHFNLLPENDQLLVLKTFHTYMMMIKYAFECTAEGFPMIYDQDENKAIFVYWDVYREWTSRDIVNTFRSFHYVLYREMENDAIIRNLVAAQLLFSITHPKMTCQEQFNKHSLTYNHLLFRYLSNKFKNVNEAKRKCLAITHILSDISEINELVFEIYHHFDPQDVHVVLQEVYDISSS